MKKLFIAAALVLGSAAPAFAQMAPGQPMPPPQQAPAQPAMPAQFSPDMTKGPEDIKGLNASVKANDDAWDHQDAQAVINAWSFPATVITTDSQGNPMYVQVDDAAMRAALTGMFNAIPKPSPGQKAAEIKFAGNKIEWVSHTLAVVSQNATLMQGMGKNMFKKQWKVTQIWSRDAAGWRIRGYVASGWGDLLRH